MVLIYDFFQVKTCSFTFLACPSMWCFVNFQQLVASFKLSLVMDFPFFLESVALPIVSAFGLLGNILSIIVLFLLKSNLSRHSSFINILIFLAIVDSLFLLLLNFLFAWPFNNSYLLPATPYLFPLVHMAMTCSVYTVVAITVVRFTTIRQYRSPLFTARYYQTPG